MLITLSCSEEQIRHEHALQEHKKFGTTVLECRHANMSSNLMVSSQEYLWNLISISKYQKKKKTNHKNEVVFYLGKNLFTTEAKHNIYDDPFG